MIAHTVAGRRYPQTRTAQEVLGDMEAVVQLLLSLPKWPPSLEVLILQGRLRYAYEPDGRDDYLIYPDWPQVAYADWFQEQEYLWMASPEIAGHGIPSPHSPLVAIDDCEGMGTHRVARARYRQDRAWPMVQEFRDVNGQLRGWHALAVLEVPIGFHHCAEIPWPERAFVMDWPYPCKARPGYRLAVVDLAWMGGMPRRREGRYRLEDVLMVLPDGSFLKAEEDGLYDRPLLQAA